MDGSKPLVRRLARLGAALVATQSFLTLGCPARTGTDQDLVNARQDMIRTQLVARGISDTCVLAAFARVERHRFVGPELQRLAYTDQALPIEAGQTISQPYIVALMTECLKLRGGDKVLEVGTGSGYQAAILACLAKHVFTIEIVEDLARSAEARLRDLGYRNVNVRAGDGYRGWPEEAPFDAIVVTCAPDEIPPPLLDQLADGGRMIIPVGTDGQELVLVEKKAGRLARTKILPVRFVPMTGEARRE